MKHGHCLKVIKAIGLVLTLSLSISSSAGVFGFGGTNWKEEVLLHDGSKIIVQRSIVRGGRHEIGQRGSATNETLAFLMPGTQQEIVWEDKRSEDLGNSNFNLLMLEILDGTVYLVTSPMGCLSYNKWGRPNPPYVVFKHQGKDWNRITLQELPAELKTPNLVISSPDDAAGKATHGVVSAETIRSLNSGSQPQYETILREAVPNAAGLCPAMVSYGKTGGWIGLDWFTDQPSLEACLKFCDFKKISAETCPCNSIFKGK